MCSLGKMYLSTPYGSFTRRNSQRETPLLLPLFSHSTVQRRLKVTTLMGKFKSNIWVFSAQHCFFSLLVVSLLTFKLLSMRPPSSSRQRLSPGPVTSNKSPTTTHTRGLHTYLSHHSSIDTIVIIRLLFN